MRRRSSRGIPPRNVPGVIALAAAAPPLDQEWEEIVDASCVLTGSPVYLHPCMGDTGVEIPGLGTGEYRARFCARNFGETDARGNKNACEQYALILWPEKVSPDAIVKQTRLKAMFKHQQRSKP